MHLNTVKKFCAQKPESTEEFPFDPQTLVFKVRGKIYALLSLDEETPHINLKCDPGQAQALRAMHDSIQPGYHMNKEHWNTVTLDGSLPDELIFRLIDESYDLVVARLPRSKRNGLQK